MISAIVAVDKNWGIGYNGELLAHIPEDLKRFKSLTENNIVVMGRKTWDSLPNKPLSNRVNYVITRESRPSSADVSFFDMNCIKMEMQKKKDYNYFIIGGGEIYRQLLPYCDRVYITKIYKDYENVDTYFPNIENNSEWMLTSASQLYSYKDITYQFLDYKRIS